MKIHSTLSTLLLSLFVIFSFNGQNNKHLFILSGQSNMARLQLEPTFIPTLEAQYGKENIIIVKDAKGGQPIRRWYKNWKSSDGQVSETGADLYEKLMSKVLNAIQSQKIVSVTFIWMQGERDAKESHGNLYEERLKGLYNQVCKEINRKDINFIIGRLNDHNLANTSFPHWTMIREIQEKVAESNERFDWVNTDNLNDGVNKKGETIKNDLHMSVEGYKIMGRLFAEKAIELIDNKK